MAKFIVLYYSYLGRTFKNTEIAVAIFISYKCQRMYTLFKIFIFNNQSTLYETSINQKPLVANIINLKQGKNTQILQNLPINLNHSKFFIRKI